MSFAPCVSKWDIGCTLFILYYGNSLRAECVSEHEEELVDLVHPQCVLSLFAVPHEPESKPGFSRQFLLSDAELFAFCFIELCYAVHALIIYPKRYKSNKIGKNIP